MKISKKFTSTNSTLAILLSLSLVLVIVITPTPVEAQKQQVTLTAIVAEPKERWDILFNNALQKLRQNHPDMDIQID
jgi:multiple sugar transport system substrate-binding protein